MYCVLHSGKLEASYSFFPAIQQQKGLQVGQEEPSSQMGALARRAGGEMAVRCSREGELSSAHLPSEELEGTGSEYLKLFLLFLPLTSLFCFHSGSGPDSEVMWEREDASSAWQGVGLEQP